MHRSSSIVALALVGSLPTQAVAVPPQEARAEQPPSVTLEFARTTTTAPDDGEPRAVADVLLVHLTPTTVETRCGDRLVRFDLAARRVLSADLAAQTCTIDDLLAMLDFAITEQQNRLGLAGLLEAAAIGERPLGDTLQNEVLFGIGRRAADLIQLERSDSALAFTAGGTPLAACTFDERALPPELRRSFAVLLLFDGHLHETVREQIVAHGQVPRSLSYSWREVATAHRVDLEVRSTDPEFPAVDVAKFTRAWATDPALAEVLALADARLASGGVATARAELGAEIAARTEAGRTLDAFLLFLELSWMHGRTDTAPARKIMAEPEARTLLAPLSRLLSGKPRELLAYLDGLPADEISHPHVLDVLRANAHGELREPQRMRELLLSALCANPCMAGAFKDLGDVLRSEYDMPGAWACWTIGRRLDPEHPMFEQVVAHERSLVQRLGELIE